ncbi:hypothetical protein F5Y17DRAFT_462412 [Xylariaceae sp. FL0594]|nr:hypothetical protein F5Y17DRAFT_462412 [Xylariaceae sp. FL0594]
MSKSLATRILLTLAGAGAAASFQWLNIPDVDAYYPISTPFVLEWVPEHHAGNPDDSFQLSLKSYLTDGIRVGTGPPPFYIPVYDYQEETVLQTEVKYSAGNYTWLIEPQDGTRSGPGWWYRWVAYESVYDEESPRGFHIGERPPSS